jgi:F-type H+-transporting ATPase subunit c
MSRVGFFRRATVVAMLAVAAAGVVGSQTVWAQEPAAGAAAGAPVLHLFGVAIGLGLVVIGAGLGIGRLAAAAADGIARQPAAADKITGAVNLPLFLLEGVAILAEVFALLVLFLANPIG